MESTKIYRPASVNSDTMDLTDVVSKLEYATRMTPTRMGASISDDNPFILVPFRGDDILLEAICHNPDEVAICRARINKGTISASHHHGNSIEFLYIQSGSVNIELSVEGVIKDYRLDQGDTIQIPPQVSHIIEAWETSCLLCITIPADPDYPMVQAAKNGGV